MISYKEWHDFEHLVFMTLLRAILDCFTNKVASRHHDEPPDYCLEVYLMESIWEEGATADILGLEEGFYKPIFKRFLDGNYTTEEKKRFTYLYRSSEHGYDFEIRLTNEENETVYHSLSGGALGRHWNSGNVRRPL